MASTNAPLASVASFSRIGPSCLHGPHHSAHRSITTGTVRERATTSVLNVSSVTSKMNPESRARLAASGRALLRGTLPALHGGLAGAQVDGAMEGKVPRLLHDSILPHDQEHLYR